VRTGLASPVGGGEINPPSTGLRPQRSNRMTWNTAVLIVSGLFGTVSLALIVWVVCSDGIAVLVP
jgi:hypothetical protein